MTLASNLRLVLFAGLVAGCSSAPGATPPTSIATAGHATGSPAMPAPTTNTVPAMTTIEPLAIDVPGSKDLISATTDGNTIWAATEGAIFTIDAATNAVTSLPAPSVAGDTTVAIADDGLWMTRWAGGHVYRLDPQTGEVLLSVEVPAAVGLAFVGDDLWVGQESTSEVVRIDRVTGTIDRTLRVGAYGRAGLGDLWITHPSSKDAANHIGSPDSVERIDPDTGATKASFKVQKEGNCTISGQFPDTVWVTCFGREVMQRAATRLDPTTNTVTAVATLPPSHGGWVVAFDGKVWFGGTFEDADGHPFGALLRLDQATGAIRQFVSIGPADPDPPVVAGGALWIPDEAGHRILRVDAAFLAG